MGQPQTEHTPCCMQEEEALPAWKTYKRRTRDEQRKTQFPQETKWEFSASTNTMQADRERREGKRISKKRDSRGGEKEGV